MHSANFGNKNKIHFAIQLGLLLFSSPNVYKKPRIDSINRMPRYGQLVKNLIRILFRKSSRGQVEFLAVSSPGQHISNKENNSIILTRSGVIV